MFEIRPTLVKPQRFGKVKNLFVWLGGEKSVERLDFFDPNLKPQTSNFNRRTTMSAFSENEAPPPETSSSDDEAEQEFDFFSDDEERDRARANKDFSGAKRAVEDSLRLNHAPYNRKKHHEAVQAMRPMFVRDDDSEDEEEDEESDDAGASKPPPKKRARRPAATRPPDLERGEERIWRDFAIVKKETSGPDGPVFSLKCTKKDSADKAIILQIPCQKLPSPSPWLWYTLRQTSQVRTSTAAPEEALQEPKGDKAERVVLMDDDDEMDTGIYDQVIERNPRLFAPATTDLLEDDPEATENTFEILSVRRVPIKVGEIRRMAKAMGAPDAVLSKIDAWKRKGKLRPNTIITAPQQIPIPFLRPMTTPALVRSATYYQLLPYYASRILFPLTESQRAELVEMIRLRDPAIHIWEAARHRLRPVGPKSPGLLSFRMGTQPYAVQKAGDVIQALEMAFNEKASTEVKLPDEITSSADVMAVLDQTNLLHQDKARGRCVLTSAHRAMERLADAFNKRDANRFCFIDSHGWLGDFYGNAQEIAEEHGACLVAADVVTERDANARGVTKISSLDEALNARTETDSIIVLRAERLTVEEILMLDRMTLGFLGLAGDRRHPYAFAQRNDYFFGFAYLCESYPGATINHPYPPMTNVWQSGIFDEIVKGHIVKLDVTQNLKTWKDLSKIKMLSKFDLFLCTTETQRTEIMRALSVPGRDTVNDVPAPNKYFMDATTGRVDRVQAVSPTTGVQWHAENGRNVNPSALSHVRNTRVELITHYLGGKRNNVAFIADANTPRSLMLAGLKFASKDFRVIFEPAKDEARVQFRALPDIPDPAPF